MYFLLRVFLILMAGVLGALAIGATGCRPRAARTIVYPVGMTLSIDLDSVVCADSYKPGTRVKGHIVPTMFDEPPNYSLPDYSPVVLEVVPARLEVVPAGLEPQFVVRSVTVNGKTFTVHTTTTSPDVESRFYVTRTPGAAAAVLCAPRFAAGLLTPLVVPPSSQIPR